MSRENATCPSFRTCFHRYKKTKNKEATTTTKKGQKSEKRREEMEKKKVLRTSSNGGDTWENLNPEILAQIFVRIPLQEMLKSVPLVCQSWREAVAGPYCWAHIDIEQWCRRKNLTKDIDFAVRRLVRRSRGTLRSLSAYKLGDIAFSFVANAGKFLTVLKIPMSDVTDRMVEKHAESLATVTVLDISNCVKITCKSLEALGKNCKFLVHLRRNMPPPEFPSGQDAPLNPAEEGEAMAVAETMPSLLHLDLAYGSFSDLGLDAILTKCKALRHLDIQGCWNVKMEDNIEQKCDRIEDFRGPWDDEYDDANPSDDGEEESDGEEVFTPSDNSDDSE
ncbi:F-box protein FBW2-like [Tasmannia lanceolata]|uniref:F-box protein FBW2-like n=1 Tax=Tasmannia lanceolata TaxID=3420 RepID=UPI004062DC0E